MKPNFSAPVCLLRDQRLSSAELRFTLRLFASCDMENGNGLVTTKMKKLAKRAGMDTKQALKLIPGLVEKGWVEVVPAGYEMKIPEEAEAQLTAYEEAVKAVEEISGTEAGILQKLAIGSESSEDELRAVLRGLAELGCIELEEEDGPNLKVILEGEKL